MVSSNICPDLEHSHFQNRNEPGLFVRRDLCQDITMRQTHPGTLRNHLLRRVDVVGVVVRFSAFASS